MSTRIDLRRMTKAEREAFRAGYAAAEGDIEAFCRRKSARFDQSNVYTAAGWSEAEDAVRDGDHANAKRRRQIGR